MKIDNQYLHIGSLADSKYKITSYDGVFLSGVTMSKEEFAAYCNEKAEGFRHSDFGNYDHLSTEQREELAKKWENAAHLETGVYDYYFNLEKKERIFTQYIKELATRLGIKYKLTIM